MRSLFFVVLAVPLSFLNFVVSPTAASPAASNSTGSCESLITQNGSSWMLHCLYECADGCAAFETTSNDGFVGYACGCSTEGEPECCHLVFVPNIERKAKAGGICGAQFNCEAGTTCEVWRIGNASSNEWTYFEKCTWNG